MNRKKAVDERSRKRPKRKAALSRELKSKNGRPK